MEMGAVKDMQMRRQAGGPAKQMVPLRKHLRVARSFAPLVDREMPNGGKFV